MLYTEFGGLYDYNLPYNQTMKNNDKNKKSFFESIKKTTNSNNDYVYSNTTGTKIDRKDLNSLMKGNKVVIKEEQVHKKL